MALRIGYVTAMWGRHELTRLVFGHAARLRQELLPAISLELACCGSEGAVSREIAESSGFAYIEAPNSPLGAKWNAALGLLRGRGLAGVCVFGSDDVAAPAYFTDLARVCAQEAQLAGVRGMCFLDLPTGRLLRWAGYTGERRGDTPGAGRFVPAELLDRLAWKLWPDHYERGLDSGMLRLLAEAAGERPRFVQLRAAIMDIKGRGGMNTFEDMAAAGEAWLLGAPRQFVAENFGARLAEELFSDANPPGRDCLIFRPWANTGENSGTHAVTHVRAGGISPGALDFLWACKGAHIAARSVLAAEYLAADARRGGATVADLDAASLLALFASPGERILDARESADKAVRDLAGMLPFFQVRSGEGARFLPLPFSHFGATPDFWQRAHIVACLEDEAQKLELARCWLAAARLPDERIFLMDCSAGAFQPPEGIMNIFHGHQVYACRALFRVVIFSAATYERLASHFMAAQTPAVCLGPLPRGVLALPAADLGEALGAALLISRQEAIWRRAERDVAKFARRRRQEFVAAIRALIPAGGPAPAGN